jgi:spore maturation protein CgeB
MKLLRFEKAMPEYWRELYQRNPGLAERSFDEQLAVYFDDLSYYAGSMYRHMPPFGYEVMEVYTNVQPLQQAWAREHGVRWNPATWTTSVPMAQAKHFAPDVVYSYDSRNLDFTFLRELREACSSVRVVTGFIGSPSYDVETFREYDFLLTCTREYQKLFASQGIETHYMTHVFDDHVLGCLTPPRAARDVVFAGAVWQSADGHNFRARVLEQLASLPGLEMYSPQAAISYGSDLGETLLRRAVFGVHRTLEVSGIGLARRRRLPLIGKAATWKEWPRRQINARLRPFMKLPVFGREMFQVLSEARVSLNCVDFGEAANMRLFEATGVGSCLLTNHRDNLKELFELDHEVVTYASAQECLEKATWLLDHPRERAEIARSGQRRTLRDHTFEHRAQALDALIRAAL